MTSVDDLANGARKILRERYTHESGWLFTGIKDEKNSFTIVFIF